MKNKKSKVQLAESPYEVPVFNSRSSDVYDSGPLLHIEANSSIFNPNSNSKQDFVTPAKELLAKKDSLFSGFSSLSEDDANSDKNHRLSFAESYFSVFKCISGTSAVLVPHAFVKGGWLFSAIAIVFSGFLNVFCLYRLIDSADLTNELSYEGLAVLAFGKPGKILLDVCICLCMLSFVIGHQSFIYQTV